MLTRLKLFRCKSLPERHSSVEVSFARRRRQLLARRAGSCSEQSHLHIELRQDHLSHAPDRHDSDLVVLVVLVDVRGVDHDLQEQRLAVCVDALKLSDFVIIGRI